MTTRWMMVAAVAMLAGGCVAGGGGDGSGGSRQDGGLPGGGGGAGGAGGGAGGVGIVEGPPVASADSFRSQITSLVCGQLAECCSEQGVSFTPAQCAELVNSTTTSNGLTYDPDAAGDCLATMRTRRGCDAMAQPDVCQRVFTGDVALGEPCGTDAECAPIEGGEVSCGFDDTCEAELRGAPGDACNGTCTEDPATTSTFCSGSGAQPAPGEPETRCYTNDNLFCGPDRLCMALVAQGGDCSGGLQCRAGLECRSGDEGRTCQPLPMMGEACTDDCAEGYCPDRADAVCTPFVALGGACEGEAFSDPCGPNAACGEGGTCEQSNESPAAFVCALLAGGGF